MKKLMFAAVAVLGLSAFAAIESSNVVGYQSIAANAKRYTMMAPTFIAVGSEAGCTLANLKVVGYEPAELVDEEWEGGCTGGDFVINFLQNTGVAEASYYWIDDGETGPGWFASAGGAAIPGGAGSVSVPAGFSVWTKGTGLALQTSGAVNKNDVEFTTNAKRYTALGNGTPVQLTLNDLTVTGYDAAELVDEEWEGGCTGGDFVVNFLQNTGVAEASYYWIDDGETGPGWFASAGGAAIPGGASSVQVPAGKGMWVKGSGLKLNIPAPAGL